jgi:isoleucyl-tRNA synthetase
MVENNKRGADFPQDSTESTKSDFGAQKLSNKTTLDEQKTESAKREQRVLKFWQDNKIFEKSLKKDSPNGEFCFYDGPPFATGTPHYGHILAGTIKDVVPRYKTMRGFHIDRKWGWDCHGLPIENLIQKENNLNTKKDIEDFGIKKFNQAAKASVFRYDEEWKKVVPKTGRWVDMENNYTTMDNNFMESVWWGFGELYKKGLVYENFRSMHISPKLETPLSNFEVNQEYKDITDISAFVRFELKDESGTSLIAWTTTPWTLFGNVALAVGPEIEYVKVKVDNAEQGTETIIIAKQLVEKVLKDKQYEIIGESFTGSELVGKSYVPVFDHYAKQDGSNNAPALENHENGWKIYAADFVTTEDGTGIVHIAPAFGEDDLNLGQAEKLPFVQHVNIDGSIKSEITELAGRQAKPGATETEPNKHQETDIEVIKMLAHSGKLFAKEKYTHSYPHCWRTHVPLLNYALSSWFIRVTKYRDKMARLNKKVNWVPEHVGSKRFGNWLENVRDWGVSRSRFWGTPIPIWKSVDQDGNFETGPDAEIEVLGSVEDIKNRTKSNNKYFLMRHGESDHNVEHFLSSDNTVPSHLTERGKNQIIENAEKLRGQKIDYVFVSPLMRTMESAKLLVDHAGINPDKIIVDDRLREVEGGVMNGEKGEKYQELFKNIIDKFTIAPEGGETLSDIRRRVGDFIYDMENKYKGKNILIVTHEYPVWMFMSVANGLNDKQAADLKNQNVDFVSTGHFAEYNFNPLPHDDDYILDLHRPYIDEVTFTKNGKEMRRIPDIFDGWVDSGSMSFAVPHYPFEDKAELKSGLFKKTRAFPADFIAEGLDQTRGWFYTLLALNSELFGKSPYKNVIVNGLVLAEDGQKMSKSLKNYPDPELIIDKYGADSMRHYLIASPLVVGEPLNFLEKGVDEVMKKIIGRLLNVVSFYELYKNPEFKFARPKTDNVLDKWILARFDQVLKETTIGLENYELDKASRPFFNFVDDLSTWYLRRSRDRIKGDDLTDKEQALETTGYVLYEFAKVLAPFMPFVAENIYQTLTNNNFENADKSVHLENWSISGSADKIKPDEKVINQMIAIRKVVNDSLEARDKVGIRVRQPLAKLEISEKLEVSKDLNDQYKNIIADEVNVKNVEVSNIEEGVKLDTNITPELAEEGTARELIRFIQTMRKNAKLNQEDEIHIQISVKNSDSENSKNDGQKIIEKFADEIKKVAKITDIEFVNEVKVNSEKDQILKTADNEFTVKIK